MRVFLFSAAFPAFDNVDEEPHFDLVCKYSSGHVPRKSLGRFGAESAAIIALNRSTEFLVGPEGNPGGGARTPRWKLPEPERSRQGNVLASYWRNQINYESNSPPVYYAIAGAWLRLGELLGLAGGQLLYWVRFLDAPVFALLVILAHRFCARWLPSHAILRTGVPWLLAFLPQDVYYSVNSDVLSAPLCLLAIHLLLEWSDRDERSAGLAIGLGLTVAAAFLTKYTNVVLVAVVAWTILLLRRRDSSSRPRRSPAEIALAAGSAALPVLLWFAWTALGTGEATGTGGKIDALGWSVKPLSRIFDHPIFTPAGAWFFVSELARTSWRGEFFWHGHRLASGFADAFYVGSTVLLAIAGTIVLLRGARGTSGAERGGELVCVLSPILSMLLLAALSLAFDFGRSHYPSEKEPYFTSGRLLSGSLVPFLATYVAGLELLLPARARALGTWIFLAAAAAIAVISEAVISAEAFRSPHNWFHMIG